MADNNHTDDLHRELKEFRGEFRGGVADMAKEVHRQNVTLTEYVTVLKRHLSLQEQINERVAEGLSDHDDRLRELEQHKAVLQATLPRKWLDADKVELDIKSVQTDVASIKTTIAKWGAVVAAVTIVAQIFVPPVFKAVTTWLFGG